MSMEDKEQTGKEMKTVGQIFDDTFQPVDTDDVMRYKKDIIQAMEEYADQFRNPTPPLPEAKEMKAIKVLQSVKAEVLADHKKCGIKNPTPYIRLIDEAISELLLWAKKGQSTMIINSEGNNNYEKEIEKQIKLAFPIPISTANPEGQKAKREARDIQEGAEWLLYNIHLPKVQSMQEEIERLKKESEQSESKSESDGENQYIRGQSLTSEVERLRALLAEKVICYSCENPISIKDINKGLIMKIKDGGLIHWNCRDAEY